MADLPERARTPIWMPTSAAASSRSLDGAWLCGSSTLLDFGPVDLTFSPGWERVDTAAKFASLAKEDGGAVVVIDGREVLVQPWQEGWATGQAMMVVADVLIRVIGAPEVTADTLEDVMASIDVDQPLARWPADACVPHSQPDFLNSTHSPPATAPISSSANG